MDPDSPASVGLRYAPYFLAAIVVVSSAVLAFRGLLTENNWMILAGLVITAALGSRGMTVPSAVTTTRETDPNTGKTTRETKTQQPLGMPAAPVAAPLPPTPPPGGPTQ